MGKAQDYNASSIKVLEGLEAVRVRPGMYIGSTSTRGLNHLIYEIVDNSVGEHLAGYCDSIHVTLERDGSCTVEDNGGGVPEKDLPHLFDRFYRAEGQKQNGAGLGLAIVKEIIYRHHGHIMAENAKGGLRFSISIPVLNLTKS